MNGSNGSFEYEYEPCRTLCPICLAKFKMNCKFDCCQRYVNLIEAAAALGFEDEKQKYEEILAATAE